MQSPSYRKNYSTRARHLSISVHQDERVVVTIPKGVSEASVDRFIIQKTSWITNKLEGYRKTPRVSFPFTGKSAYLKYKERASRIIIMRVREIAKLHGFKYGRITIRDQKTRWGSCSHAGNLNFSYKIFFLPQYLQDYIIIHELCHLKELNHSKRYWRLVEEIMPNYKIFEAMLRKRYKL